MEDNQKKMLMLVIGGGLLVAIVYYFFMKPPMGGQPRLLSGTAPARPPQASTPTTTVAQQPIYVSGGGFSGTSSNLYVRQGAQSSEVSRLQTHLNKGANLRFGGRSVSVLSVDGFLGNNTYTRIEPQFPSIGANARRNGGLSRAEFDTIMNTPMTVASSSTSSTPSAPTGVRTSSGGCTDINPTNATFSQLQGYITCKTGARTTNWYASALREWAKAVRENKATFQCTQCYTTGTYSTRTGLRV